MPSLYAIASRFAGPGIGHTAFRAVSGLWDAGQLGRLVALGHEPTVVAEECIADVWFPPRRALWFLDDKRYYREKNRWFDRACRRHLGEAWDVVHLWNSQATGAARRVKESGRRLIIERASMHILTQTELLIDAYARHGIAYEPTYRETIERCVEEYELADLVLTPSPLSYRSFRDRGFPARKLVRLPFGADLARYQVRARPPERFRAVFVGQLGVRKGILTLLEAWRQARIDGELWLIGGEEPVIADRLRPWRNDATVKFLGFRSDVPELLRASSAFVFPSVEEGSALVTYEAMACGLPLVVTDEAGSIARDGQEARVVPAHDVAALAAALVWLAEHPDDAWRLGQAARRRVESYPWANYSRRIALVHRLVATGRDGEEIMADPSWAGDA